MVSQRSSSAATSDSWAPPRATTENNRFFKRSVAERRTPRAFSVSNTLKALTPSATVIVVKTSLSTMLSTKRATASPELPAWEATRSRNHLNASRRSFSEALMPRLGKGSSGTR